MEHDTTTMAVVEKKRNRIQVPRPQWSVVRKMLHMRIKDAAAELNVSESRLRRLCKKNGYEKWPGKTIRFMNGTVRLAVMLGVAAPEGSPWARLAGPSQLAKVAKTKKKGEQKDITGIHKKSAANPPPREQLVTLNLIDITGIHNKPAANHPPREELVTLNLIDRVGLSSASSNGN